MLQTRWLACSLGALFFASPLLAATPPRKTPEQSAAKTSRELFVLGQEQLAAGDLRAARDSLARSVDLAPHFALGFVELGTVENLLEPGSQQALRVLRHAVQLAPDNARAHFQLGLAFERSQNHAGAISSYNQALKLRPDWSEGWFRLGTVLAAADDAANALLAFERVLHRQPEHLGALAGVARVGEQLGKAQVAENALLAVTRLQPTTAYHYYQLGQFYTRHGRPKQASTAFAKAEHLDPRPKRTMRRLR